MCLPSFPQWVKVQLRLSIPCTWKGRAGQVQTFPFPLVTGRMGTLRKMTRAAAQPAVPSFQLWPLTGTGVSPFFLGSTPRPFPTGRLGLRDNVPGDSASTARFPAFPHPRTQGSLDGNPSPSCIFMGLWSRERRCPQYIWYSLERGRLCGSQ